MRRANFAVLTAVPGESVTIKDLGPWDKFPTVTNVAEDVVLELVKRGILKPGERLYYVDSENQLDEILIYAGKFAGFKPGPRVPE